MPGSGADRTAELLDQARRLLRAGDAGAAWQTCREAADLARLAGRADQLADAAVLVPPSAVSTGAGAFTAEQHALCLDALDLLGNDDPLRRQRVVAQLTMTGNPFARRVTDGTQPSTSGPSETDGPRGTDASPLQLQDDATRLLELQARRTELIGAEHATARLELAGQVLRLAGSGAGERAETLAWGHLYRLESLYQLGRRVELNAELIGLTAVMQRLADPVWHWRLLTVRASLALLENRLDDATARLDEALAAGRDCGLAEAEFLDLVLRSRLSVLTGSGLADIEPRVRDFLDGAPFFAHGWHARLLWTMGRRDDAIAVWRSLAMHLHLMPRDSQEWLVATAEGAYLAAEIGDTGMARQLYAALSPLDGLHVIAGPQTPPYGPVSLYLGRLAATLGDPASARRHLTAALDHCRAMNAPGLAAQAQDALTALGGVASPISAREREVAGLISAGATNREIAERLHLSERTVENHVSHILRKLDLPNRTALARWVRDRS